MRLDLPSLIDPALSPLVDESRRFYASRIPGRGPADLEELRAFRSATNPAGESDPPPSLEVVSAGGRAVPLRIHSPRDGRATGVLLEIHGGGFYMGSSAAGDVANRRIADELGIAVISVDYRLAPEHPWPAAPDDCETAALWLAEHAHNRFGTTRVAVCGFSAGATLAMTTLVRLRDRGIPALSGAVLQFGTYDLSAHTPAGRRVADEYFLDAYAGKAADRTHPDISPVFADLSDLPPILIVVGSDDILLEDNLAMASRLSAAGVAIDVRVYPASPHAFTGHPTAMARAANHGINAWLRTAFDTPA